MAARDEALRWLGRQLVWERTLEQLRDQASGAAAVVAAAEQAVAEAAAATAASDAEVTVGAEVADRPAA